MARGSSLLLGVLQGLPIAVLRVVVQWFLSLLPPGRVAFLPRPGAEFRWKHLGLPLGAGLRCPLPLPPFGRLGWREKVGIVWPIQKRRDNPLAFRGQWD